MSFSGLRGAQPHLRHMRAGPSPRPRPPVRHSPAVERLESGSQRLEGPGPGRRLRIRPRPTPLAVTTEDRAHLPGPGISHDGHGGTAVAGKARRSGRTRERDPRQAPGPLRGCGKREDERRRAAIGRLPYLEVKPEQLLPPPRSGHSPGRLLPDPGGADARPLRMRVRASGGRPRQDLAREGATVPGRSPDRPPPASMPAFRPRAASPTPAHLETQHLGGGAAVRSLPSLYIPVAGGAAPETAPSGRLTCGLLHSGHEKTGRPENSGAARRCRVRQR